MLILSFMVNVRLKDKVDCDRLKDELTAIDI